MATRDEWKRVNGSHRTRDVRKGLEARIADPLWMLARQWQFGEFKGDDAATPAQVQIKYKTLPLQQLRPTQADGKPGTAILLKSGELMEPLVEREAVAGGPSSIRMSAEAGIQFVRRLPAAAQPAALAALKKRFPLKMPSSAQTGRHAFLSVLVSRSFDAQAMSANAAAALATVTAAGVDRTAAQAAIAAWTQYYAGRFSEPARGESGWQKERLEYRFDVSSVPNGKVRVGLVAREYPGGQLDWYHFDLSAAASAGLDQQVTLPKELSLVPSPVRYSGMPADRFWDFEDGTVFFGGLSAGATDLAQLVLTEFATVYGNDWYMAPVPVEPGSVTRIVSVTVIDSFGESHVIEAAAAKEGSTRVWRYFELTGDTSAEKGFSPWLFVPRTVLGGHEDRPVERVVFTRDEMANLAWGIEEMVEGHSGHRVSRHAQWMTLRSQVSSYLGTTGNGSGADTDAWIYRLLSVVPPYWVPFVPEVQNSRRTNRLVRGRMGEWDLLGELKAMLAGAKGRILDATAPMTLQEEEIPGGAIEVTRAYQAARDSKGNLVVWAGRRKRPASGNRSSGRETDKVET